MRIFIDVIAKAKIDHWVEKSPVEVSGLGRCSYDEESETFYVSDVWLVEQTNSACETEMTAAGIAKLDFATKDMEGYLNFWWHSHVNMDVFWSKTDHDTIHQIGGHGFCLATVFNKRGEYRSAYYQNANDFLPSVWLDDLDTEYGYIPSEAEVAEWDASYEKECSRLVYTPPIPRGGYVPKRWDNASGSFLPAAPLNTPKVDTIPSGVSGRYTYDDDWSAADEDEYMQEIYGVNYKSEFGGMV